MTSTKNIKYRVACQIHKLKISKNIDFQTKVVWKRHHNKAQTTSVRHAHGYSIFNQILTLEFNLVFNTDTMLFQTKNVNLPIEQTELVAVIEYQGKVKSGGYVKYNISENLNTNPHGASTVSIPLSQCPDPAAFIQATFSYEKLGDEVEVNDLSILNASSRDLNMSRVDFHDDKFSLEMDRINETIKKLEQLSEEIKKKKGNKKVEELKIDLQIIDKQKKQLEKQISQLQKELSKKQQYYKQQKKKGKKQTQQLVKQLQKKNKQIKDSKSGFIQKKSDRSNYKQMYQNSLKQIQLLKKNQLNTTNFQPKSQQDDSQNNQNIEQLQRQNVQLQSKVASMSHKLAQLFNASYEYGGAKLLDFLQTSIGLTQVQ